MINEQYYINNKPYVDIFYWKDGQRKVKTIKNVLPYFYVPETETIPKTKRIVKIEKGFKDLWNRKMVKVYTRNPKDIIKLKNLFKITGEADVQFHHRVLIDSQLKFEEKPTIQYMDIEVLTNKEGQFPDVWLGGEEDDDGKRGQFFRGALYPVISIVTYDNVNNEYHAFLLNKEKHRHTKKLRWKNIHETKEPLQIHYFLTERELLQAYINYTAETRIGIISGWYSDSFDIPYLINRCIRIDVNFNHISPLNHTYVKKPSFKMGSGKVEENLPIIKGIMSFDLLKGYKGSHAGELESTSLNNVASKVLGLGKLSHERNIRNTLLNPHKLVRYNIRDVELLVEIDKKLGITDHFWDLSKMIGCRMDKTFSESHMIDFLWLKEAQFNLKRTLPTKDPTRPHTFKGAHVVDPKKGDYDWVFSLDLKALYPSIIRTYNMSPETIIKPEYSHLYPMEDTINLPNGVRFRKDIKGITPGVLQKLFSIREANSGKKKEWEEKIVKLESEGKKGTPEYNEALFMKDHFSRKAQHAKDISNSYYGVLAYAGARLYAPMIGESITFMGRLIINHSIKKAEEQGCKVLYGDTDSIYCLSNKNNLESVKKEGLELGKFIDKSYEEILKETNVDLDKHYLHLAFEKVLRRAIFIAKKRYAFWVAYNAKGARRDYFSAKGLETQRSDNNDFVKEFMKDMYSMVLLWDKNRESRTDMEHYLIDMVKYRRKNIKNMPIEKIGLRVGFQKEIHRYRNNSAYAISATYCNEHFKTKFGKGSKPFFVYIKTNLIPSGYPRTVEYRGKQQPVKGICFEVPEQIPVRFKEIINYDEMKRRLVDDRAKALFGAIGISFDTIHGQKTLEIFCE